MKKTVYVLSILVCTMGFAQENLIESLVTDFERGKTMTLDYIEAMPSEKYGEKPTEGVRSFSEQMLHISQGTIGLVSNGTGAEKIYAGLNLEKDEALQSKEEVTRIVTEAFDFAIASIKGMDKSKLDEIVVRGPFKVTRLGWVMKAHEHMSHHKGQCAVYLRLAGIVPPKYQLF